MRRTTGGLLALALLAAGLVTSAPAPAAAEPAPRPVDTARYVALGDSYAAGYGLPAMAGTPPECARSRLAYPELIDRFHNLRSVDFVACSGATVIDVRDGQVGALGPSTRTVTLTVGGNDAGFAELGCLQTASCDPALIAVRVNAALVALAGGPSTVGATGDEVVSLASLFAAIHERAPRATIFLTGYPRLFGTRSTLYGTGSPCPVPQAFRAALNDLADRLNGVLRDQARLARAAGVKVVFVSVTRLFAGHGLCDAGVPFISGTLHPTAVGQLAYAAALVRQGVAR